MAQTTKMIDTTKPAKSKNKKDAQDTADVRRKGIKAQIVKLEKDYKDVFEADSKRKAYLSKLKQFFNETVKGASEDRWDKLETRLSEFC